jgi:hypothetical protein
MEKNIKKEYVYYVTLDEGACQLTKTDELLAIDFDPHIFACVGDLIKSRQWSCSLQSSQWLDYEDFVCLAQVIRGHSLPCKRPKQSYARRQVSVSPLMR